MIDIRYSIDEYNKDGLCVKEGLFLHAGDVKIKVARSVKDFERFIALLTVIKDAVATIETFPKTGTEDVWGNFVDAEGK